MPSYPAARLKPGSLRSAFPLRGRLIGVRRIHPSEGSPMATQATGTANRSAFHPVLVRARDDPLRL